MAKDGELSEQFAKTMLDQLSTSPLAPTHFPHFNVGNGAAESQLDLQRKLIEHQIEVQYIHSTILKFLKLHHYRNASFLFAVSAKPAPASIEWGEFKGWRENRYQGEVSIVTIFILARL